MIRIYERYSNGIFSNDAANYISNVRILRQKTIKRTPSST